MPESTHSRRLVVDPPAVGLFGASFGSGTMMNDTNHGGKAKEANFNETVVLK